MSLSPKNMYFVILFVILYKFIFCSLVTDGSVLTMLTTLRSPVTWRGKGEQEQLSHTVILKPHPHTLPFVHETFQTYCIIYTILTLDLHG